MSESPTLGTAVLGQSARFQCTAIGDIEPSFTWTRNEVVVDGGKLMIFNVMEGLLVLIFSFRKGI